MTNARTERPSAQAGNPGAHEPEPALVAGLSAIADTTRLRILAALREGHEACKDIEGYAGIHVSDLARQIGMTQPAVSQHLARLRQARLVEVTRKGQFAYYRRSETGLARLREAMAAI